MGVSGDLVAKQTTVEKLKAAAFASAGLDHYQLVKESEKVDRCGRHHRYVVIASDGNSVVTFNKCNSKHCPSCEAKRLFKLKLDIEYVTKACAASGSKILSITTNMGNHGHSGLKGLLSALSEARTLFLRHEGKLAVPGFKRLFKNYLWVLEIEIGPNGWRPHLHWVVELYDEYKTTPLWKIEQWAKSSWYLTTSKAGHPSYSLKVGEAGKSPAPLQAECDIEKTSNYLSKGSLIGGKQRKPKLELTSAELAEYVLGTKSTRFNRFSSGWSKLLKLQPTTHTSSGQKKVRRLKIRKDEYKKMGSLGSKGLLPLALAMVWAEICPRIIEALKTHGVEKYANRLTEGYGLFEKHYPQSKLESTQLGSAFISNYHGPPMETVWDFCPGAVDYAELAAPKHPVNPLSKGDGFLS